MHLLLSISGRRMGFPVFSLVPFSTIVMAETGQTLAHFLHPMHLLSVSSGLSRSNRETRLSGFPLAMSDGSVTSSLTSIPGVVLS